jgi:hypothetical protein
MAVAIGGSFTVANIYFDVLCGIDLQIDFSEVQWNGIVPGFTSDLVGDTKWDTPSSNRPTARNGNNDGLGIALAFTPMIGVAHGMSIDTYSACFGLRSTDLACRNIPVDSSISLSDGPIDTSLCAGEVGLFILSLRPQPNLPADIYRGTLRITGYSRPGLCYGSYHPN